MQMIHIMYGPQAGLWFKSAEDMEQVCAQLPRPIPRTGVEKEAWPSMGGVVLRVATPEQWADWSQLSEGPSLKGA